MPNGTPPYRRAVLGMGAGGVDRRMLRTAAEFARLLDLEMLGLFIEDRSLLALAALPFARELRLPGHDWRALEVQVIGDELRAAALRARKLFEEEIEPQGIAYSFEVQRGDPAILSSNVARPSTSSSSWNLTQPKRSRPGGSQPGAPPRRQRRPSCCCRARECRDAAP